MDLSVIGILVSLALIIVLALRGFGIMLIAPLAVVIVSLFSSMDVLDTLLGPYMKGFVNYAAKFYLIFVFASVFGKYMEDSGAARSVALKIMRVTGDKSQLYILLAISLLCSILTLGGVSLFVVIFAIMPIARPLFRRMNIPWHLFMAAFMLGNGGIQFAMIPGNPSVINIMPTRYLHTTAMAAPLLGCIAALVSIVFGIWYVKWALARANKRGESYVDTSLTGPAVQVVEVDEKELPNFWLSLVPLVAVIVTLNVIKLDIVWSMVIGSVVAAGCFWGHIKNHLKTLNDGAFNSAIPVINTCADVGYGMAVAATSGFKIISEYLVSLPGTPLVSLSLATFLMTGITGSASGGLGIVLETLIGKYVAMGLNPEMLHRIVVISSGAFDAMPHNGVVITSLAVAGLTHRQAYGHIWWVHVVNSVLAMIVVVAAASVLY
jgi:H+/gluconate symporter-like permease